jgi:hypothetical protein
MNDELIADVIDNTTKNEQLTKKINEAKKCLATDKLNMSFGEIVGMYERNELIINFSDNVLLWNKEQQSKFIESILVGLPLSDILIEEISKGDDAGKWELVDGFQRILTVLSFFGKLKELPEKNNLILSKGSFIKLLEGYTFKTLPLKHQLDIRRAICGVAVAKWDSGEIRNEFFKLLKSYKNA